MSTIANVACHKNVIIIIVSLQMSMSVLCLVRVVSRAACCFEGCFVLKYAVASCQLWIFGSRKIVRKSCSCQKIFCL